MHLVHFGVSLTQVTDPLERHVKDKLKGALDKFTGAEFIECEGGLQDVDVRLM